MCVSVSPYSLANVQVRLEELATRKQDIDKALTLNDVNAAAARAVEHADRRADNIIKSIGGKVHCILYRLYAIIGDC